MTTDEASVSWSEYRTKRVILSAPAGSAAATVAAAQLDRADRIVELCTELLAPAGRADHSDGFVPTVYLVEHLVEPTDTAVAGIGTDAAVWPVDPAVPAVARPLTRLLVGRWFGPHAAASPWADGIAEMLEIRVASKTAANPAHDWVRARLAEGHEVSILGERPSSLALASFVSHLVETHGPEPLRRLLAAYDPARRDAAALAAYHQPAAALEHSWLAGLQRARRGPSLRDGVQLLLPLLQPHRLAYAEILAYQALLAVVALVLPVVSGCVVGALGRQGEGDGPPPSGVCRTVAPSLTGARLAALVGVLVVVYLARSAVSARRGYAEGRLFFRIGNELQERMFAHLQRLPHGFYGAAQVGDVAGRLVSDTRTVQAAMAQTFGTSMGLALTALAATATALVESPAAGAMILIVSPLLVVTHRALGARMSAAGRQASTLVGETMAAAQENLSAHAVVKAFSLEERAVASYRQRLDSLLAVNVRLSILGQLFEATITLAVAATQLAVLGIGGYLILRGTIDDPGTLVTLLALVVTAVAPITSLASGGNAVVLAAGAIERVTEILDSPVTVADRPGARPLPPLADAVRFEAVHFGYEPGRPVLRGLDLVIPAGASVAVVGASGSGKSTLLNLMMRFWDPDAGRVLFDGEDVRYVTLTSLRGQIGLVFQDTFVFNTSLRDNIAIGRPGASDAEVEAAARAARLESLVASLPRGFDTVLGERGVRMSGGQRQRLALARAILRDPAVLVLDEPTSALDARTEAEILETLRVVAAGRTTVTITHRLALAATADQVVVLHEGRVAEQGTHEHLLQAGGIYRRLWDDQQHRSDSGPSRIGLDAARLAHVPLLAGLGADALEGLAAHLHVERYEPGEDIVRQGEAAERLYLLAAGQAAVVVADEAGERTVNHLHEGDYFGELALLTDQPRSATVRASAPTEAYSLDRTRFLALVEAEPTVRERLSQLVFARRAAYDAAALAAGISQADTRTDT